jgi:septum site-determining protein MinD
MATIVSIHSFRGGTGKSNTTANLATLLAAAGQRVLLIDTHPGLHEETLLSLVISHVLLIVLRPDQQDYEGTGVTVKVAQGLQVPRMLLMVNKTPPTFDPDAVRRKVEDAYGCRVAAVLPHSDEMMNLASEGIFVGRYPDHPMTALYKQGAADLVV